MKHIQNLSTRSTDCPRGKTVIIHLYYPRPSAHLRFGMSMLCTKHQCNLLTVFCHDV